MKLGLIGAGNMASALARGIGEPVLVADVDAAQGRGARATSSAARRVGSNAELAERADVVVLCHKPEQLDEVAEQVGGRAKVVVSILGGHADRRRSRRAYPGRAGLPLHPEHPRRGRARACSATRPGARAPDGPEQRGPRAVRPRRGRSSRSTASR